MRGTFRQCWRSADLRRRCLNGEYGLASQVVDVRNFRFGSPGAGAGRSGDAGESSSASPRHAGPTIREAVAKGKVAVVDADEASSRGLSRPDQSFDDFDSSQLKDVTLNKMMLEMQNAHLLKRRPPPSPQDMRVSGGILLGTPSDKGRCKEQDLRKLFIAFNAKKPGSSVGDLAKQYGLNESRLRDALKYTLLPNITQKRLAGRMDIVMVARKPGKE